MPPLERDAADDLATSRAAVLAGEALAEFALVRSRLDDGRAFAARAHLIAIEALHSSYIEGEAMLVDERWLIPVVNRHLAPLTKRRHLADKAAIRQGSARARRMGLRARGIEAAAAQELSAVACADATLSLMRSQLGMGAVRTAHRRLMGHRPESRPGITRSRKGNNAFIGDAYTPPLGGPLIPKMLDDLCEWTQAMAARAIGAMNGSLAERCAFVVVAAGIAHHRFEAVHPFVDGNGRIGRSYAEALMASVAGPGFGSRSPIAIATQFSDPERRDGYYRALGSGIEGFTEWWIAKAQRAAEHQALRLADG